MTRLLLVEDDADIVKNLTLLLQQDGFEVTTASGQAAALQALDGSEAGGYALALADGNGYAVCTAAKKA